MVTVWATHADCLKLPTAMMLFLPSSSAQRQHQLATAEASCALHVSLHAVRCGSAASRSCAAVGGRCRGAGTPVPCDGSSDASIDGAASAATTAASLRACGGDVACLPSHPTSIRTATRIRTAQQ